MDQTTTAVVERNERLEEEKAGIADDIKSIYAEAGRPGPMSLKSRFEAFHRENPHIYELFKRFAFEAAAGHKVLSAR